ncbi:DUF1127 domain-containing protein [Falsiroseomonas sp.]|uniref:DUF1127 domain-containing protein n=1 Tax=Falsiroseomonas sp. TaxID=2870721 RepID=UPI0027376860|nr:DUF1127 domain-containing protein [Falsiroseomonas sp.]MDP3415937.1 DUF1127 domain-containing protein [Falsiroseomonas sp.]
MIQAAGALRGLLRLWWQRHVTRRALDQLDARLVKDIGVSGMAAREEAGKWFWQT